MRTVHDLLVHCYKKWPGGRALLRGVVADILSQSVEWTFLNPDAVLASDQEILILSAAEKLNQGVPTARVTGKRYFCGQNFEVSPYTLDPRPETEKIVEYVVGCCKQRSNLKILDIGAGTGCIGLSVLQQCPSMHLTSLDVCPHALETVQKNACSLNLEERVRLCCQSVFDCQEEVKYDCIVSNPPYIATSDLGALPNNVRSYDPILALDGGDDGLDFYRKIFSHLHQWLNPDGMCVVEFGFGQVEGVREIVQTYGLRLVSVIQDYRQVDRFVHVSL